MPALPAAMIPVAAACAPPFSRRVWGHAQALPAGAVRALARRTVAAALRGMGLTRVAQVHLRRRALGRARRSGLAARRARRRLPVAAFAPTGPLAFGVDETPERRRGKRI